MASNYIDKSVWMWRYEIMSERRAFIQVDFGQVQQRTKIIFLKCGTICQQWIVKFPATKISHYQYIHKMEARCAFKPRSS
jgi:hypothetical protein